MNKITCKWIKENLSAYLDGELGVEDNALINKHLEDCLSCRQLYFQLQHLRETLDYLSKNLPSKGSPTTILEGVSLRLPKYDFGVFSDPVIRRTVAAVAMAVVLLVGGFKLTQQSGVVATYAKAYPGAVLRGASQTGLKVQLDEGSSVFLEEGAVLEVLSLSPDTSLSLKQGVALFSVALAVPGRKFTVVTPQAQVEALGTIFRVCVEGGKTQVEVLKGSVQVKSGEGVLLGVLKQSESAVISAEAPIKDSGQLPEQRKSVIFWREIK